LNTQNRRTTMPITAAVYPRGKGDNTPPAKRLLEHRLSRLVLPPAGFRVERQLRDKGLGSLIDGLERERPEQQTTRPKRRRRGGRGRKPVTA
jgi:hypothetical protein